MTCGMLGAMFKLIKIESNGDAIIFAVTYKGSLNKEASTVNCTSFFDVYQPFPGKLPTNADYEHKHAMISPAWQITECSSKITMGLGYLARVGGVHPRRFSVCRSLGGPVACQPGGPFAQCVATAVGLLGHA